MRQLLLCCETHKLLEQRAKAVPLSAAEVQDQRQLLHGRSCRHLIHPRDGVVLTHSPSNVLGRYAQLGPMTSLVLSLVWKETT